MKVYDKLYVLRGAARKTLKRWLMNNPNWLSWLLQLKYLPKSWFLYGILARVEFASRPQKVSTAIEY